jgi:hypothetical protein
VQDRLRTGRARTPAGQVTEMPFANSRPTGRLVGGRSVRQERGPPSERRRPVGTRRRPSAAPRAVHFGGSADACRRAHASKMLPNRALGGSAARARRAGRQRFTGNLFDGCQGPTRIPTGGQIIPHPAGTAWSEAIGHWLPNLRPLACEASHARAQDAGIGPEKVRGLTPMRTACVPQQYDSRSVFNPSSKAS